LSRSATTGPKVQTAFEKIFIPIISNTRFNIKANAFFCEQPAQNRSFIQRSNMTISKLYKLNSCRRLGRGFWRTIATSEIKIIILMKKCVPMRLKNNKTYKTLHSALGGLLTLMFRLKITFQTYWYNKGTKGIFKN